MSDIIHGTVIRIIDENTFDLYVEDFESEMSHEYPDWVRIKIISINPDLKDSASGRREKHQLEEHLLDKEVTVNANVRFPTDWIDGHVIL